MDGRYDPSNISQEDGADNFFVGPFLININVS